MQTFSHPGPAAHHPTGDTSAVSRGEASHGGNGTSSDSGTLGPRESPQAEPDWPEDYQDTALFSSIFSAPSLALAGFVFALTGLLGGMIPESLPYLIQVDPTVGPAFHVRIVGVIAMGFAIIAASLGLAAMLRAPYSPFDWPRYLGAAAVLLAMLLALQSILLFGLAGVSGTAGIS